MLPKFASSLWWEMRSSFINIFYSPSNKVYLFTYLNVRAMQTMFAEPSKDKCWKSLGTSIDIQSFRHVRVMQTTLAEPSKDKCWKLLGTSIDIQSYRHSQTRVSADTKHLSNINTFGEHYSDQWLSLLHTDQTKHHLNILKAVLIKTQHLAQWRLRELI